MLPVNVPFLRRLIRNTYMWHKLKFQEIYKYKQIDKKRTFLISPFKGNSHLKFFSIKSI